MDPVAYAHSAKQAQRIEKFIENPDSASGVLTQPSVIQAGETITVPTGRTAILANTQIDGTLTVDGTVFIPSGANFSDLEGQIATKATKQDAGITVNVGAGQTYTTINQALEYLSGFYPMYKKSGITATINLKAGFIMAEQVLVSGIDLGWITIVGEDVETIITHTALTTAFYGGYPAFGVDKGGTSPIIGQLFRFNVEKVGGNKHGLLALGAGSSADVLSGKGFVGAGTHGVLAGAGATINAIGANFSNAGTYGVLASSSSTINASAANCSNARETGIYATDGSTINANGANCSNAGTYGVLAGECSTINARNANCSNAGSNGIFASAGSTINAITAIIQNQTTGSARLLIIDGSHIEATGIITTGGTVPVFSQAVNTLTGHGIIYQ